MPGSKVGVAGGEGESVAVALAVAVAVGFAANVADGVGDAVTVDTGTVSVGLIVAVCVGTGVGNVLARVGEKENVGEGVRGDWVCVAVGLEPEDLVPSLSQPTTKTRATLIKLHTEPFVHRAITGSPLSCRWPPRSAAHNTSCRFVLTRFVSLAAA